MAETVLVLDDDVTILESVTDYLNLAGFEVIVAHNGLEGLEQLDQHTPDIIVSDIAMPRMDGYQFFERVREKQAWLSIPFIFLTAKGEPKQIREGYTQGVDHYITKPFDPDDLVVLIKTHLQRSKEVRQVIQRQIRRHNGSPTKQLDSELRAPLYLVQRYLEIYQAEKSRLEPQRAESITKTMHQTLNRMVSLFEDLMLIVYIDSGAIQVEIQSLYQPIDLTEMVREVLAQFSDNASQKDVSLVEFLPDDLPTHGHTHFIRGTFHRLIDNAIKFSPHGGNVWIEAKVLNESVIISIRDEGMGISEQQQQNLFTTFQDPERVKVEKQGGGLGLAIASRLIRLHGGEVQVESTLGKGSTFTVVLPKSLGEV